MRLQYDTGGGPSAPSWLRRIVAWGGWVIAVLQGILSSWPG